MLATPVFVFNVQSLGSGLYSFELYFQNPAKAVFLNINDVIEDTATNKYKVISPTVIPNADGNVITTEFVTTDVAPVEDEDYDSLAYTPDQEDLRPEMQTGGSLGNASLHNGPNYEYSLLAGWSDPVAANKAVVGDRIVDFAGKEFEITFIDNVDRFDVPIRIKEVEKVGVFPTVGDATLYRPTPTFKFFQGTPIPGAAITKIQARDIQLIDRNIGSGGGDGNGDWVTFTHTINSSEAAAKQITLSQTPVTPAEVKMEIQGLPIGIEYGEDFSISGNTLSWNGLGLDGELQENDILEFWYFAT